jgi:predicted RNA binding protein YcfA (HicA-like mRNA interferase family)
VERHLKLLRRILAGRSDANVHFEELRALLLHLGFEERARGSHHIFRRPDVEQRINLQRDGSKAKPYQVRQVRAVIVHYRLGELPDA